LLRKDFLPPKKPVVWSIAGSDSGGGAGLQADLLTFHDVGCHGCTVPTALTAQNSVGVTQVEFSSDAMIAETLSCLGADLPAAAVKTGMLGRASVMTTVAQFLEGYEGRVVCDPVMVSTSGSRLLEEDAVDAMVNRVFPHVDLLTPNLHEAEALLGRELRTPADIEAAADELLAMGPKALLIKGGHFDAEAGVAADFYRASDRHATVAGEVQQLWLSSPKVDTTHTHGTGCTLSAAICGFLARGASLLDAVTLGKAYVTRGLRASAEIGGFGAGPGPVQHAGADFDCDDFPCAAPRLEALRAGRSFPRLGAPIGALPVVPDAAWVKRLAAAGAADIQLRMKGLTSEDASSEAKAAAAACAAEGCNLWINDDWRLAAEVGAFGVHLGQEDLAEILADAEELAALRASPLRLGLSTHCHSELAVALGMQPSYVSLGPVFGTNSKTIAFDARSADMVSEWRRLVPQDTPLVAIGGITLTGDTGVEEVRRRGAEGVAVISAVTAAADPEQALRDFAEACA